MKHSIANTFAKPPSVRSADVRCGRPRTRCFTMRFSGSAYSGSALRWMPVWVPRAGAGTNGGGGSGSQRDASSRAGPAPPAPGRGRARCVSLKLSCDQPRMRPARSTLARIRTAIAEPYGSHACSSSRLNVSSTIRPGSARATSAASSAASSAPLCP